MEKEFNNNKSLKFKLEFNDSPIKKPLLIVKNNTLKNSSKGSNLLSKNLYRNKPKDEIDVFEVSNTIII